MKLSIKKIAFICVTFSTLLTTGCATIFGRSNYKVSVNSNPTAASITITDKKGAEVYSGTTPATVELKSSSGYFAKGQYQIKFHLSGYDDRIITLNSKLNGWYFGNLVIGGVVGMLIIDPASGAMYKITDTNITESLQQTTHAQESKLEIIDINSLPKSALKGLVKINYNLFL